MDKFSEMQTLVAVVEHGSFVKAADALSLSKAAVSRHLGQLEARLGARLLHRTTRRLSLTEEGEVFYARCKSLLAEVDEAYPPLWRLLAERGVPVGVCGSVHSNPCPKDPSAYAFYLPDRFARRPPA